MQYIIAIIFFAIIFSSCEHTSKTELAVFSAAAEGSEQSNKQIYNATNVLYHALEERLVNPQTAYHAKVWQPKAEMIKTRSADMVKYIEQLVEELKNEASVTAKNDSSILHEENMDAVTRLFVNKKKGEELYKKLENYKQDVLSVDPRIDKEFSKNIVITSRGFELDKNKQKDFTAFFFNDIPVIAGITILNRFENNIRVVENKLVQYCFHQIGSIDGHWFTKLSVLVSQSATIVKAGDQMQVEAGVGEISISSKPTIKINGKIFEPDYENPTASYQFKTPRKAGKYSVPVIFEYIDEMGRKQSVKKTIEYTVVE